MDRRRFALTVLAFVLAILPAAPLTASAALQGDGEEATREVYTGSLIGLGGTYGGRTTQFTLDLTSRATKTQATRYAELLRAEGQDALVKQLDDRDMGRFSVTGSVGRKINFAYVTDSPEGRRVTILFERWIQPFELRYGSRSQNYPFTFLEFTLDKNGKGSGTLIGAAKVYFDKDDPTTLNVENFGVYPVRVTNVQLERKKS